MVKQGVMTPMIIPLVSQPNISVSRVDNMKKMLLRKDRTQIRTSNQRMEKVILSKQTIFQKPTVLRIPMLLVKPIAATVKKFATATMFLTTVAIQQKRTELSHLKLKVLIRNIGSPRRQ